MYPGVGFFKYANVLWKFENVEIPRSWLSSPAMSTGTDLRQFKASCASTMPSVDVWRALLTWAHGSSVLDPMLSGNGDATDKPTRTGARSNVRMSFNQEQIEGNTESRNDYLRRFGGLGSATLYSRNLG